MIFTFLEINGWKKIMFYATGIPSAIEEMRIRYGSEATKYSLISYVDVKDFNLTKNKSIEFQLSKFRNEYTLINFDFQLTYP
jgi:hypothetical protein